VEQKIITKEQAVQKLRQYCSYQERSHYEVRQKLYDLKVSRNDHDEIIASLITDDYLNEERFAKQYAGGKFRTKGWGLLKIRAGLQEKRVSSFIIVLALKEIEPDAYLLRAQQEARKKYNLLKGEQEPARSKKTMNYLFQKGYEHNVIIEVIQTIK
jgi:regulatory protein